VQLLLAVVLNHQANLLSFHSILCIVMVTTLWNRWRFLHLRIIQQRIAAKTSAPPQQITSALQDFLLQPRTGETLQSLGHALPFFVTRLSESLDQD
jgi:hypothetical protein